MTDLRRWLLDKMSELDSLFDHPEPHESVWSRCAAIATETGDHAARLGFSDIHQRSLQFPALAEPMQVKTFLADCLATIKDETAKPKQGRFTPPDVAKIYGVSPDTVRLWISQGHLQAVSISKVGSKRPRYRIEADALAEFDRKRAAKVIPPAVPQKRRSKKADLLVTMFSGGGR